MTNFYSGGQAVPLELPQLARFQDTLRSLQGATVKDTARQRSSFCAEYLQELAKDVTERDSAGNRTSFLIATAYVRRELARQQALLGDVKAAEESLLMSLHDAEQTSDEQVMYSALHNLGLLYFESNRFSEACDMFQRSMLYA